MIKEYFKKFYNMKPYLYIDKDEWQDIIKTYTKEEIVNELSEVLHTYPAPIPIITEQDTIDYQLSKGNMSVFSMLNTKYFIVGNQQTQQLNVQMNPQVCGNAWFINEIKFVPNADSEMNALTNFNPKNQAIIDERFKAELGDITLNNDSTSSIKLTKYAPMQLDFESNANGNQFAVFSDIYYNKGWNVYVDGVKADYVRVNYLLRGMKIASGKHSIVFKFEPEGYIVGEKIALASSLLLVLLVGFGAFKAFKE